VRAGHDDELDRIRAAYRERDRTSAERVARGWDSPAYVVHAHELEWQLLAALRAGHVSLAGSSVIDIGSGGGYLLNRLAELGAAEAVGVDLVPERVAEAQQRYPRLDLHCASATELPFPDDRFDIATQFTCLSSVLDAVTRRAIAAEMLRVVRPGGVVLSYDLRPSPRALRALRRVARGAPADASTPTQPLSRSELEDLFGRVERVRDVQLNLDLAEMLRGRRGLIAALRLARPLRSHTLATFRVS
jgi:SAM-dependent methyltransferase